ncbi:hypothetical protein B0T19DRAFT_413355 [Cercophora scortea]|uniref:NACHT domain-containing protein n=1 Tax=Cercophora scortea TaxID=314031 RepID=A0AAE0MNL8_9PEZI|nr:hypothetical protein B0T19DRAFT_413355 [Cercophora scortea]
MDPLSLSSGIIAVIGLAKELVKLCKGYIDGVKQYPKELRLILVETKCLLAVFEGLEDLRSDDGDDAAILETLRGPNSPVERCQKAINELLALLSSPSNSPSSASTKERSVRHWARKMFPLTLDQLAWPLKRDQARALLDEITTCKTTVVVALSGSVLQEVRSLRQVLDASQRREVYTWLQQTDPSSRHNAARCLYEKGTGEWVLRSEEWKNWIKSQSRSIWIHGIPGAGKTVLAAHLVDQIRVLCSAESDRRTADVYYYCYHGNNQDETVPLLRWLICQLCRQSDSVSRDTYDLFRSGRHPDVSQLLSAVAAELTSFSTVFFAIDALDESKPRPWDTLLTTIDILATDPRFQNLQLLATSREYAEIERVMSRVSVSIPMSHPLVELDIKTYVAAHIRKNRRFQKWPEDLKREVEDALSKRARGMFRLAVCRLDIIKRLNILRSRQITDVIAFLPNTLDESYERIFSLIPSEHRDLVRFALRWVAFWDQLTLMNRSTVSFFKAPASLLLAYSILNDHGLPRDEQEPHNLVDVEILRECSGCLLDISGSNKTAYFAHYTVREFLESDRVQPADALFHLDNARIEGEMLRLVISRASSPPQPLHKDTADFLYGMVARLLIPYGELDTVEVEPELIFRLFDPRRAGYNLMAEAILTWEPFGGRTAFKVPHHIVWHSDAVPAYEALLLFNLLRGHEAGKLYLAKRYIQSIGPHIFEMTLSFRYHIKSDRSVSIAAYEFRGNIVEFLAAEPGGDSVALWSLLKDFRTDFAAFINPTEILKSYLDHHNHVPCRWWAANGTEDCSHAIKMLEDLGALPPDTVDGPLPFEWKVL